MLLLSFASPVVHGMGGSFEQYWLNVCNESKLRNTPFFTLEEYDAFSSLWCSKSSANADKIRFSRPSNDFMDLIRMRKQLFYNDQSEQATAAREILSKEIAFKVLSLGRFGVKYEEGPYLKQIEAVRDRHVAAKDSVADLVATHKSDYDYTRLAQYLNFVHDAELLANIAEKIAMIKENKDLIYTFRCYFESETKEALIEHTDSVLNKIIAVASIEESTATEFKALKESAFKNLMNMIVTAKSCF